MRHPRARRATLRFDPRTGLARATVPPRMSVRAAQAFVAAHAEWLAAQRARRPRPKPFVAGAHIPLDDALLTIDWQQSAPRGPRRIGDTLVSGGPIELLAGRVTRYLRVEALRMLSADTCFFAERAGVSVEKVAVGDAISRWGSCSSTGTIRYNWRLACAPSWVRRATAAHEVTHRLHMNHSPAFHAVLRDLLGADPSPARAWLRRHGAELHALGRIV